MNSPLSHFEILRPLAEMICRHSPYNYAFNNPVYFIDPDGMSPLPVAATSIGMGVDGVKDIGAGGSGGFDVRTFDRDGNTLDSVTVNSNQGVDINADGDITKNDLQTSGDGGSADLGLGGGGKCPDGDCDEKKSVVWKDDASETVNAVNSTSAIAGGVVGEAAKFIYNEKGGYWMDKQGKMRSTNWGGNGSTGGKHGYARTLSNNLKSIGTGIGVLNATLTTYQYRSGQMSGGQYTAEMISSGISYYLPAWAVGWELGRLVTQIPSYQENFRQPIRSSLGLD